MDYDDDAAYMEAMRQFYEETEKLEQENNGNQSQLQIVRNQCEKEFLKAKKILWKLKNEQWILQLDYTGNINFEI